MLLDGMAEGTREDDIALTLIVASCGKEEGAGERTDGTNLSGHMSARGRGGIQTTS